MSLRKWQIFFCLIGYYNFCEASVVPIQQDVIDFVSIDYLLRTHPEITYRKCHDAQLFDYGAFPLSVWPEQQPYKGKFAETFVVSIPQGRACSEFGIVLVDGRSTPLELMAKSFKFYHYVNLVLWAEFKNVRKVPGRVAVISQLHVHCYGHWLSEVLGRLAILEILGIEYDWIYLKTHRTVAHANFMRETLALWGIDEEKIIEPYDEFNYIQADELIVPSLSNRRTPIPEQTYHPDALLCAAYYPEWMIQYLRKKFLPMAHERVSKSFSKKVFISRKDGTRKITNEDEFFSMLQPHGFERYELSKMHFLEQVALFHQADIVIGTHGSGLANLMFCKPTAHVLEIFQARSDSGFYTIAKTLGLRYDCFKTIEFDFYGHYDTPIPATTVQEILQLLGLIPTDISGLPEPYSRLKKLLPFNDHGWYLNAAWIEQLIKRNKITNVIEVGSWLGLSTRHIASLLPAEGKVFAVDTWEGDLAINSYVQYVAMLPTLYDQFLSNIVYAGLTHKVIPVKMDSQVAAHYLRHRAESVDLIYIDASHETDAVMKDLESYFQCIRDNSGILCGDDWLLEPVRLAVISFAQNYALTIYADHNFWFLKNEGKFALKSFLQADDTVWSF